MIVSGWLKIHVGKRIVLLSLLATYVGRIIRILRKAHLIVSIGHWVNVICIVAVHIQLGIGITLRRLG